MNTCKRCGKSYTHIKSKGTTTSYCGGCRTTMSRHRLKYLAVEFMGGKCNRCGYSKTSTALVFHHVDPEHKTFSIGGAKVLGWPKIKEELKKCEMLCMNCHAEEHAPIA